MEKEFNHYMPFMDTNMQNPMGPTPDMNDPFFNPMMQYEQGYCYYKYLCMQMEYKIKCKEYEKMCESPSSHRSGNERINRKVE